ISPYFERVQEAIRNGQWLTRYCSRENPAWGKQQVYSFIEVAALQTQLGLPVSHQRDKINREIDLCMKALGFDRIRIRHQYLYAGSDNKIDIAIYRKHLGVVG